jgi:RNA polymerase sigma-70 factor (ECF subfamily)
LLRVYLKRASYVPSARFTTWLYQIASNLALNWLRDRRHDRLCQSLDTAPGDLDPPQIPDRAELIDTLLAEEQSVAARNVRIREAIAALPDRQRAAVLLQKYDGMDYAQIAQVMDCTVPTIKSLLHRAHSTLRRRLSEPAS